MILIVLAVLGLAFGSFVHAFTWRLHELDSGRKLSKRRRKELSIVSGRSMCGHCGHELAWYDLLPVVSWVILRGRCRYCGRRIKDNPLVELGTAGLFVLSYLAWPYGFDGVGTGLFVFWLIFLVGFVALAVYDLKWMELPNRIVYALIGLAVAQVLLLAVTKGGAAGILADAFWGFVVIGGFFYALFQVSDGKWIGGGDVKLGFLIGLLVGGPLDSIMVIFFASLAGTLVCAPSLAMKSLKLVSRIPFGPFLLLATVFVYLFGDRTVDWYNSLIL